MSDQAAGKPPEAEAGEPNREREREAAERMRAAAPILMRGLESMRSAHGRPEADETEETR